MFTTGSIIFICELLLAQLILLYSYPKRKLFLVRYVAAAAVCIVLAYFFPMPAKLYNNPYHAFFRFFVMFMYSFVGALFCFKCKKGAILAACVCGYSLQHISYHIFSMISLIDAVPKVWWMESVVCLVLYIVYFFTLGIWSAKKNFYNFYDRKMLWLSVVTIIICVGLSRFARLSYRNDVITVVCMSLYSITCCALVLALQYFIYNLAIIKTENKILQRISEEEKKQYEISKANMELLNIKCHDIKQRLSDAVTIGGNYADSLNELVEIYDGTVRTGLEVLDIILYEKNLQCREKGIKLTFIGDGGCLAFMNAMDIYSLFGNALTNAMEALDKTNDPELKTISVIVENKGDFIFVNTVNYFSGKLITENGLPVTDKENEKGFHGYGMKSIRNIAEKYQGGIAVNAEDGMFSLNIYLQNANR